MATPHEKCPQPHNHSGLKARLNGTELGNAANNSKHFACHKITRNNKGTDPQLSHSVENEFKTGSKSTH
jgi:hypothetical protein